MDQLSSSAEDSRSLQQSLSHLFHKTTCSSATFVSTLHVLALSYRNLVVPSNWVFDTALRTHTALTGIAVLEKQIRELEVSGADEQAEPSLKQRKMARGASVVRQDMSSETFNDLARLYKNISEDDIVIGVYEKISTQRMTRRALGCSLRSDWAGALQLYEEAVARTVRHYFWCRGIF